MSVEVRHDAARQRFEAHVEGGAAYCAYRREGQLLRLHHTEVPREAEGRGVAGALVRAAMRYATDEGLRIVPECTYVREYMRRHPETHALLAECTTL